MSQYRTDRSKIILISSAVIILGVMVLTVFLAGSLIDVICSGCMGRPIQGWTQDLTAIILVFAMLFFGLLVGVTTWLLLMKPFFSREEIEPVATTPHIPVISKVILAVFNLIYPNR